MAKPLLSAHLWDVIEPSLPVRKRRFRFPGRKPLDDCRCLTGILYLLKTGIWWEYLPQEISWFHVFPRLRARRERRADIHLGFTALGASLVCWDVLDRSL